MKKILSFLLLSVSLSHQSFGNQKAIVDAELEKFAEIDTYIENFNKNFEVASSSSDIKSLLNLESMSSLNEEDKKWLSNQLARGRVSNIRLKRLGDVVTLYHARTHIPLTRFDVSQYSKDKTILWEGRSVELSNWDEMSAKKRAEFLSATLKEQEESKKSLSQKIFEKVFFVATLPLQILTACASGGGTDAALAGGTSASRIQQGGSSPRDMAIPRPLGH
jgi:uncharacterized protein YggL (DUF469 family)